MSEQFYYDDWGTGSTAGGDMASNYSAFTGGYDFGGAWGNDASGSSASNAFFSYFQPSQPDPYGEGTPGAVASWTGGGAAASSNPIMDILGNASKWFGELKPQTQSSLIALGGSFLAGAMGAKKAERLLKTQEKSADASMMNAQTTQRLANSKVAARSDMSNTNFGKPRAGGIMSLPYKNKLAERQANPGGSGLIGAA